MILVEFLLTSRDVKLLDSICSEIRQVCERSGVEMRGPIPLPVKVVSSQKVKVHRRIVRVESRKDVVERILAIPDLSRVRVEIELKGRVMI